MSENDQAKTIAVAVEKALHHAYNAGIYEAALWEIREAMVSVDLNDAQRVKRAIAAIDRAIM